MKIARESRSPGASGPRARRSAFAAALVAVLFAAAPSSSVEPIDRALAAAPETAAEQVRDALRKGDTGRALDLVRREIAAGAAKDRSALRLLEGRLLVRQGERAAADAAFVEALQDSAWSAEALADLVQNALAVGEFDRAEGLLSAAPDYAARVVPFWRAQAAFLRGDSDSAEAVLARQAGDDGGDDSGTRDAGAGDAGGAAARLLAANLSLARGRTAEGIERFEAVLAADPDERTAALAHYGAARAYGAAGADAARAREDERALKFGAFTAASWDAGLALRALGRPEEARLRLLEATRPGSPCAVPARLAIAAIDRDAGRRDPMRETLAAALEGELADAFALLRLGESLRASGRDEDADFLLQSALDAFPGFRPLADRVPRLTSRAEPIGGEGAVDWDSTSLAVGARMLDGELPLEEILGDRGTVPVESARRLLLAAMHHLGGNHPGAIGWSEGSSPRTPGLHLVRALALERVGRGEEALAALDELAASGNGTWLVEEHRARLQPRDDRSAYGAVAGPLVESRPRDARLRIRCAARKELAGDLAGAIELLRAARKSGWLTPSEKRRLRDRIEDLEDLAETSGSRPPAGSTRAPDSP